MDELPQALLLELPFWWVVFRGFQLHVQGNKLGIPHNSK
jgi:hypothetical protein